MYDLVAAFATVFFFTTAFTYLHACEQLRTRPRND
jgi:hypothetical protein